MQYLQSFDQSGFVLDLDSGKMLDSFPNEVNKSGWFKIIDGTLTGLLKKEGMLFFIYSENLIPLGYSVEVELSKVITNKYSFKLLVNNEVKIEFLYWFDDTILFEAYDTSGFVEREDFDWGTFLKNIINNKKRQEEILKNYKS